MTVFWRRPGSLRQRLQYQAAAWRLCSVLLLPAGAGADTALHPLPDLLQQAADAAMAAALAEGYSDVEVTARPLDGRLRLRRCAAPLTTHRNPNANALGPVSIGVRCDAPQPWNLYVRLDVSTRMAVPVLARALPRGAIISEADIEIVTRSLAATPDAIVLERADLLGREVTRPTPAGTPLRFSQIRSPTLVERGQTVTLVAGKDGVHVSMQGRAMGNAAAGERVVVTNLSSGRRIEGVVNADGSVRIP